MTDALKYVVIWGAGALGEHVHYLLSYDSNIHVRAFLDSNPEQVGKLFHGLPVLAATKESLLTLKNEGATHGIVAIGNGPLREQFSLLFEELGYKITNAIHPSAQISPQVRLGQGVIILANVNLFFNPVLGNYVFVANSVTVSHDNSIDDNVSLNTSSTIVARAHLAKNVYIGAAASVVHPHTGSISVGEDAIIGAGALVIKDVPARAVVHGVPAEIVRYRAVNAYGLLV